jgi:hypothetical protein
MDIEERGTRRPKYERVSLRDLRQGRKGKHHTLITEILGEIEKLPEGQALKIPLSRIKGVPVANLRSSMSRATKTRDIKIATYSDARYFYVWKRTSKTSSFERKVKRLKPDSR